MNTVFEGPFYQESSNEVETFRFCYQQKLPILLKGPTGCGKSRFVEYMANQLKRPLVTVSCNEDTSAIDLLGRYLIKGGDTQWHDGPLTRAVREGAFLYLDEVVEAREDVVVLIHSLSDHRRELFLDAQNECLLAPDSFMLIMSYNPGYQRSFKELKMSTRQRFVALDFSYPSEKLENKIVSKESGLSPDRVTPLIKVATKIRAMNELSLGETVSTRLLVNAAKLIQSGLASREASRVAISRSLSDDPDIVQAIDDLADLYL